MLVSRCCSNRLFRHFNFCTIQFTQADEDEAAAAALAEEQAQDPETAVEEKKADPRLAGKDIESYIHIPRAEREEVPHVTFAKLLYHLTTSVEEVKNDQSQRRSSLKTASKQRGSKGSKDLTELLDPSKLAEKNKKTPPCMTREETVSMGVV